MKIAYSPYELEAIADSRRRAGALLQVHFPDGAIGYADVHPWPEFGDAPLDEQLRVLASGGVTPILARSMAMARLDAVAREHNRSLFEGLSIPPSHDSMPHGFAPRDLAVACQAGYTSLKLKNDDFSPSEITMLRKSRLRVRVDFNAKLTYGEVCERLRRWGALEWVDWLEDPCPFDAEKWDALRQEFKIRLALDLEDAKGSDKYDVRVVKPARMTLPSRLPAGVRLCVTSSLDHPVGQLGAAYVAAQAAADGRDLEVCGLATHQVYRPNHFSRQLTIVKGCLVPPDGTGIGFDKDLAGLDWQDLSN